MSEAELPDITETPVPVDNVEPTELAGAPVLSPQLPAQDGDGFKPLDPEPPAPVVAPAPRESSIQSRLEEMAMPNIVPNSDTEPFGAGIMMDNKSFNNANAPDIGFNPVPKDIVNEPMESSLDLQGAADIGSSILGNSSMSEMELQVQAQAIKFAREMQSRNQGEALEAGEGASEAMGALSATSKMLANSLGMKLPPPEYSGIPGIPEQLADTEPVASKKKKKKKKKKNGQKIDDIDESEVHAVIEAPPSSKPVISPEPMRESTPDIPQLDENRPAPDEGMQHEEGFPRFLPDREFPPPHERFHHGPPDRFPPDHFPPEGYPGPHEGPGPDHPMFHMHRGRGRGRGGMYDGPHRPPYDEYEGYEEEYGWRGRGRRGRGRPFPRHGKFRYRDDFDEEDFEEFGMPPDDFRHEHGPYHPGHGPPDMGYRPPRPPFGPEFSGPPRPGPPGHYGPPHEYGPRPPGPGHYGPRGPPNFPPHGPGYHEGYPGGYQGGPPFQPPPENFHGETFPPNFEGQHMPPQGHPGQPMPPHGHPGQPLPPHGHPGQPMPPHGPPLPGQPPPQQSFTGEVFPPEGFNAGAPFPHGMPPMPNMAPNDPNNPMPNQQTAENLIAQGMNPDLAKILNADVVIPPKVDAEPGKDKQKKKKKKGKGEALATEPSIQPMSIPLPEDVPLPPEPKKKKKKEKSKGLSDVLFPPLPESEPQFQGPAPRPMPENQPPLPMEVDQPAPPTDPEFLGPKPPEPDSDQFRGMIFNPQPVSGNIHVKEPKPPRRSRFDQVEPTPTIKSEPAPMPVPVPSPVPPPVMPVSTTQEFISQENISGIQEQLIKSEVGVEKIENPESNSDFDAFTEELLMQQKTFQEQQEALRQEQQVMQAESPINNVEKDMKESIPTDRANGTDETKKDDYVFFGNMIDSKEEKKENEAAQNKEPVTASQLLEKFKQRKLMKTDSDPDIKSRSREYGPPIVLSENKFSKKAENIDEQNVQKTVKEEPKAQGKFTIAIRKLKQIEAAQEEEEKHVMDSLVGNSESEVDKAKQSRKEKDDKSSKEKVDDSFESSKERKKRSKSRSKERTKKGRKYSGSRSASRERSRTPEKSRKYRDKMQSYSRSNSRERSTSRSRKSKSRERNERSRYRRSRSGSERRSRDREQKRSKDRHSRSKSREMVARKGKSMSPWRKDREFFKRYGRFPREGEADHIRYELPQTQRERGKHWDRDDQRDNRGRDFERRRRNERESRETESVDRKRDRRSSERSKDRDKKSNKEKESRRQSKRDSSDEESDESYVKEKRKERKKKKKEMHMEEQDENSDKERKRKKKSKKDVSSDEAEEEHYKRDESLPKDKPSKDTKEEQIFEKRSTKERGPYTEEKRSEKSMDEEKEETSQRFDEHKGIERDEPYKESEVEAKQSEPGEIEELPKIPEMEGKNKIEEEMETEDGEITERDNEYPDVDQQTKDMLGVGQYIDDVGERSIDKEDDRMDTSKRESSERKHKEKKKKKRYSSSNSEYSESDLDQNDEIKYKKDRRVSSIERTKDEDYKKADPEKRSVVKRENKDEYPSVRDQKKMDRYRYGEDDEDGYENRGKKGKKHQSEDESDYDVRKSKKPKGKQREEFDEDEDAIENDKRKKERSYAQEESKFRDDDRRRDQRPSSKERGYTRDDIGNERGYGKDDFRRRENEKDTKRNDRRKEKYRLEDEMRKGSDRYQESEQGRQQKSSRYDKPEKDHERRKRYDSESEDDYRKRRQQRRNDSSEERSPRSKRQEKKRDAYDDMSSVPKNVVKSKWDSDNSDTGSEEETRKPERKERSESYKRESSGQPPVRPKDKFDIDISKINKAKLLDKMMNTKKKENDHSDEDSDDQDEEYPKQKRKKEARKIDKKEKKKKNLPSDSENEKPIKKSKKKKKEVTSDEDESPKKKDRKKKKKYNDESDQNSMDDEYSKKRIDREQTSKSKKAERKGKHRRDDSENNDDEAEYNKKKRKDKAKSRHMSPDEEETSEKEDKQRRKKRNESDDEMKERGRKREKSTDKKKSKVKKKYISESDGESDDRNSKEKYRRKKEKANDQDSDRDSFRKEKQWKKEKFSDQDSDRESLRKERKSKKERDPSDSPKRKRDKQDKKKKRQRSDDSESRSPSRSRTVSQKKKQKYTPSESEDESRGKKDRRRKYESSENDEERYPKKTKKKAKESKKYEKDLNDDSDEEMLQESRNKQKDKSDRKSRKEMTDEEDEVRRSSERSKRERNGKHKRSVDRYSDDDKYNDRASNQDDRKRGKKRDDILDEKGRRIDEGGGGGTRKFWKGDDEKHTQKQSKKSRKYSTSDSETSSHNSSDSDSSRSDSDHQKKYKTSKTGSKNVQAGASPTRGLVPDYPIESEEEKAKESNQKQKQKKGKHKKKKKHKHKKLSKKGKDKHEKDGDEDYLIKDKEEAVKTVSDNTDEILETQNTNEQLVEVSEPLKTSDRMMEAQDGDDSLKTTNEKNPAIPMQSDNVENTKKSNDKKDDQIKKGRLEENLETMKAEENKVFQRGESEESDTTQDSTSPGKPDVVVASFPDKRNHEKNDNSLKNDDETNDQQCHPVKESGGNNVKHDNQSVKNESFHEKDISPEKNIILYDPFESLVTDTVEKKESGNEDGNQLYDPFETMLSHEEKDEYTKTNEEHYSKADLLEQNIKSLDKEIQNAKNLPAKDVSAPSVVPIAVNPNQTSILPISNLQQNIFPVPLPVQAPSTYVPSTVFPSIDQPKGIIQEPLPTENITKLEKTVPEIFSQNSDTVSKNDSSVGFMHETMTEMGKKVAIKTIIPKRIASETPTVKGKSRWDANGSSVSNESSCKEKKIDEDDLYDPFAEETYETPPESPVETEPPDSTVMDRDNEIISEETALKEVEKSNLPSKVTLKFTTGRKVIGKSAIENDDFEDSNSSLQPKRKSRFSDLDPFISPNIAPGKSTKTIIESEKTIKESTTGAQSLAKTENLAESKNVKENKISEPAKEMTKLVENDEEQAVNSKNPGLAEVQRNEMLNEEKLKSGNEIKKERNEFEETTKDCKDLNTDTKDIKGKSDHEVRERSASEDHTKRKSSEKHKTPDKHSKKERRRSREKSSSERSSRRRRDSARSNSSEHRYRRERRSSRERSRSPKRKSKREKSPYSSSRSSRSHKYSSRTSPDSRSRRSRSRDRRSRRYRYSSDSNSDRSPSPVRKDKKKSKRDKSRKREEDSDQGDKADGKDPKEPSKPVSGAKVELGEKDGFNVIKMTRSEQPIAGLIHDQEITENVNEKQTDQTNKEEEVDNKVEDLGYIDDDAVEKESIADVNSEGGYVTVDEEISFKSSQIYSNERSLDESSLYLSAHNLSEETKVEATDKRSPLKTTTQGLDFLKENAKITSLISTDNEKMPNETAVTDILVKEESDKHQGAKDASKDRQSTEYVDMFSELDSQSPLKSEESCKELQMPSKSVKSEQEKPDLPVRRLTRRAAAAQNVILPPVMSKTMPTRGRKASRVSSETETELVSSQESQEAGSDTTKDLKQSETNQNTVLLQNVPSVPSKEKIEDVTLNNYDSANNDNVINDSLDGFEVVDSIGSVTEGDLQEGIVTNPKRGESEAVTNAEPEGEEGAEIDGQARIDAAAEPLTTSIGSEVETSLTTNTHENDDKLISSENKVDCLSQTTEKEDESSSLNAISNIPQFVPSVILRQKVQQTLDTNANLSVVSMQENEVSAPERKKITIKLSETLTPVSIGSADLPAHNPYTNLVPVKMFEAGPDIEDVGEQVSIPIQSASLTVESSQILSTAATSTQEDNFFKHKITNEEIGHAIQVIGQENLKRIEKVLHPDHQAGLPEGQQIEVVGRKTEATGMNIPVLSSVGVVEETTGLEEGEIKSVENEEEKEIIENMLRQETVSEASSYVRVRVVTSSVGNADSDTETSDTQDTDRDYSRRGSERRERDRDRYSSRDRHNSGSRHSYRGDSSRSRGDDYQSKSKYEDSYRSRLDEYKYQREKERERERYGSRERSRERDRHRGRSRDRVRSKDRDRSRERDRSRDRKHRRRHDYDDKGRYDHHSSRRDRRRSYSRERRSRSRGRRSRSRERSRSRDRRSRSLSIGKSRDKRSRSRDRRSRSLDRQRRSRSRDRKSGRDRRNRSSSRGRRSASRDRRSRSRDRHRSRRSRSRSKNRSHSRERSRSYEKEKPAKVSALDKLEKEIAEKKKALVQSVDSPVPSTPKSVGSTSQEDPGTPVVAEAPMQAPAPHFLPQPFPVHEQQPKFDFQGGPPAPEHMYPGMMDPNMAMYQSQMMQAGYQEGMPPMPPFPQGPPGMIGPDGMFYPTGPYPPGPMPGMDPNYVPPWAFQGPPDGIPPPPPPPPGQPMQHFGPPGPPPGHPMFQGMQHGPGPIEGPPQFGQPPGPVFECPVYEEGQFQGQPIPQMSGDMGSQGKPDNMINQNFMKEKKQRQRKSRFEQILPDERKEGFDQETGQDMKPPDFSKSSQSINEKSNKVPDNLSVKPNIGSQSQRTSFGIATPTPSPSEDVKEPVWSASEEEKKEIIETPEPKAPETPCYPNIPWQEVPESEKPIKVKSRWRQSSEAQDSPSLDDDDEPPDSEDQSEVDKENLKQEVPIEGEETTEKEHKDKHEGKRKKEKKADKTEDDESEEIPINFDLIDENIYLMERRRSKQMREVKRMVCDCTTSREDREMGYEACGEDCLNRMLFIECGSKCPCGDHCTNKRFQKKQNSQVAPFRTDWKGYGLKALEDLEPGQFVMEYVGEVLDYRQFKSRSKQYSKQGQEHFYFMAVSPEEVVDATLKGNVSRFINHSCDPNCETQKWTVNGSLRVGFFVRKPIKKDEEITFDYKYEVYGKEAQKCYCGTDLCRGWLGGDKRMELKSSKRTVDELEKKKKEMFDDSDKLEEEIERMSELQQGLRNKNDVLNICRLMVRAEDPEHRALMLKVIENTSETACLRLFLDYHGLSLLWCWMADLKNTVSDMKLLMLKILKKLPITNKTILTESKVLDIVTKWSEMSCDVNDTPEIAEAVSETTDNNTEDDSEVLLSPPVTSNKNPISILSSLRDSKVSKKRVKFADEASSSDSESRTSESDYPAESVEGDVSSTSQVRKSKRKLTELRRKVLNKDGSEPSSENVDMSESRDSETIDAETSQSNEIESSQKESEVSDEVVETNEALTTDKNEAAAITEEDKAELEHVVKAAEIKAMAKDLLSHWANLKEVYKIPKKEVLKERKRTEKELDTRYDKIAKEEKMKKKVSGWDIKPGRKRKRESSYKEDTDDSDSGTSRKANPNLTSPPKLSKSERRQLFEAQVKAQDEMNAEYQRQQEQFEYEQQVQQQLHMKQLMEDPNFMFYAIQDPSFLPTLGIDPQQFIQSLASDPVLLQSFMAKNPNFPQQLEALTLMYQQVVMQASQTEMVPGYIQQEQQVVDSDNEPMTEQHLAFLQQVEAFKQQHLEPQVVEAEEEDIPPPPSPPKNKTIVLPPNWKTAKDAEGKLYYYHTATRQTQWDPPNLDTGEHTDDMDLGTPTLEDPIPKPDKKETTTTAAADTSSETSKKLKEQFKSKMSSWIVVCLNPFRKPDCKLGKINSTEDFKHLARKLTHHVMAKELKHCRHVEDLEVNENVKSKAKDFVKKYMTKFGDLYKRSGSSPNYD